MECKWCEREYRPRCYTDAQQAAANRRSFQEFCGVQCSRQFTAASKLNIYTRHEYINRLNAV